jgi:hypothetical protein
MLFAKLSVLGIIYLHIALLILKGHKIYQVHDADNFEQGWGH